MQEVKITTIIVLKRKREVGGTETVQPPTQTDRMAKNQLDFIGSQASKVKLQ